jgi:hypothetical protein
MWSGWHGKVAGADSIGPLVALWHGEGHSPPWMLFAGLPDREGVI